MRLHRRTAVLILTGLGILLSGACRKLIIPEPPDFVEYGWELMAEESYRAAIVQFTEGTTLDAAYADGWNGLGWAYAKLGVADTSDANFTIAITKEDTTIVATERQAGRSFAKLALGQFSAAVSDAKGALTRTPGWVCRRDETITFEHVTLTAATAYYGLAEYDSCLVWIRKLDNTFTTSVTTLAGRSRLAARLETLKDGL